MSCHTLFTLHLTPSTDPQFNFLRRFVRTDFHHQVRAVPFFRVIMAETRPDDQTHFESVDWCAAMLRKPDLVPFTPISRLGGMSGMLSGDTFFRDTLLCRTAIRACIGIYHPASIASSPSPVQDTIAPLTPRLLMPTATFLYDLGTGLNGWNGTAHGGLIAALMDESMGSLIWLNLNLELDAPDTSLPAGVLDLRNIKTLTAGMDVKYERPIRTPQIVILEATQDRIVDRKIFIRSVVRNKEGAQLASCIGTWMAIPTSSNL